jgi:AraC-like DNA-binding protein
MRDEPQRAHRVTTLAARAGLSQSRFLHLFKAETGVPLRRYRIWNRMGAAIRASGEGASLTEAAHAAGFASSAHFSSAFRDMFGMMPSDLARALRPGRPKGDRAV